ncbi:MAG: UPF0311 protein [marine bacterium B5-7]|nr:MAG: UPF0311 protein [marine bacterium B5-7]
MKLEPLFTYYANLGSALDVGNGPFGKRMTFEVHGGEFKSEKLNGKIRDASCADWMTISEEGYGHLDVRASFETDDGANIYVQYSGIIELTAGTLAALAGESGTNFGEQNFFTNPRMQTGDARYNWVNNIFCVARGRLVPGKVEYEVFQLVND